MPRASRYLYLGMRNTTIGFFTFEEVQYLTGTSPIFGICTMLSLVPNMPLPTSSTTRILAFSTRLLIFTTFFFVVAEMDLL